MTDRSDEVVFNLVWTGVVFEQLALFTESVLAHSGARMRFIGNACPPEQLALMERFAEAHPGRVVEVVDVSPTVMLRHGDCLDQILRTRDDGELFGLADPDIFVRGPFLPTFVDLLAGHDAVTSGRELWSRSNVIPEGHAGVNGEYFFDRDGYVFGSPHFAIYKRSALDETVERWGVGFSSAGNDLSDAARDRIAEVGRTFWIYDTGKIVNILLQADGGSLVHQEHPDLIHIGGVSHFISPPTAATTRGSGGDPVWGEEADWGEWDGMADRYAVARYAAAALRALTAGRDAPAVPAGLDDDIRQRLTVLRHDLEVLVAEHGSATAAALGGDR